MPAGLSIFIFPTTPTPPQAQQLTLPKSKDPWVIEQVGEKSDVVLEED